MILGTYELDLMIDRLRKLPELAKEVAPACALVVEAEIKRTTAAGTDSYDVPWKPKKYGGGRPLVHAIDAVAVAAVGASVIARVKGINKRHHLGQVNGKVKRGIIPIASIPPRMAAGMVDVIGKAFLKVMAHG